MTVRFQQRRQRLHLPIVSISFMSFAGISVLSVQLVVRPTNFQIHVQFRLLFRFHCRLKADVRYIANDAVSAQPEDIPYRYRQTHIQRRALLFH